ncbi:hypothetical protein RY831_33035, partial [Noviherbaspirillum sp. CPCC 100848]
KTLTSVENAYGHWKKHRHEFHELPNSKQYVDAAYKYVNNPPENALMKIRNKDVLFYDQRTNTFLVKGENGAPKTMFRPKDGIEYWNRQ